MCDDVPDDGLDEALASTCALAEVTVVAPNNETFIDLCVSSTDSYVWKEFFTQAQRDSLGSPSWKSMDFAVLFGYGKSSESTVSNVCGTSEDTIYIRAMEVLGSLRGPGVVQGETTNPSNSDVPDALRKQNDDEFWETLQTKTSKFIRKIVKRRFQKKEETVGGIAPRSILSAAKADSVRWRNGVFHVRSLRELFQHCSGLISNSSRVIHDILPDTDGRRIAMLLEQLGTTRKSTGLWLASLHRRHNTAEQLVLPGALLSRAEAIEFAETVNAGFGDAPDRHAHIIHVCPWA